MKILKELLDNACKFSNVGSPIAIHGQTEGDTDYVFRISDQGRGMTAEQIANIGAYMQFERSRYEQQGMGLGLTIAQMLVRLHDGHVRIESKPDQGTTVTITLKKLKRL